MYTNVLQLVMVSRFLIGLVRKIQNIRQAMSSELTEVVSKRPSLAHDEQTTQEKKPKLDLSQVICYSIHIVDCCVFLLLI